MDTPLYTQENLEFFPKDTVVETFLADADEAAPPLDQCTAAFALVFKDGKILLLKESPKLSGTWELPGGGLDFGENIYEGLKREIEEDLGV